MTSALQQTVDHVLSRVISNSPRVPGVVAMITDRNGNIYEGAAGKRMLGQVADMTTDTVFAIFSTTKQAEAPGTEARHHHAHVDAAHCRLRL